MRAGLLRAAIPLVLLASSLLPATQAAPTVQLLGPCSAQNGETVEIRIRAAAFDSRLAAFQAELNYDPTQLQRIDVDGAAAGPFGGALLESVESVPGVLGVSVLDCGPAPTDPDELILAVVRFNVLAPLGTPITVQLNGIVALDEDGTVAAGVVSQPLDLSVVDIADRDCDGAEDADDNCPDVFNPDQADSDGNGVGDVCQPLLFELADFGAKRLGPRGVHVYWKTVFEQDNAGFNLFHAKMSTGPWTQLNKTLIPARGNELEGASYGFADRQAPEGPSFYRLEGISSTGIGSFFGPIEARGVAFRRPDTQRFPKKNELIRGQDEGGAP